LAVFQIAIEGKFGKQKRQLGK